MQGSLEGVAQGIDVHLHGLRNRKRAVVGHFADFGDRQPREEGLEPLRVRRADGDDEPAVGFGEEQGSHIEVSSHWNLPQVHPGAELPADGGEREGDGQPPLGRGGGGFEQSGVGGPVHRGVDFEGLLAVDGWYGPAIVARRPLLLREVAVPGRSAQLVPGQADHIDAVAGRLEGHRDGLGHIVDLPEGGDEQRWRDGDLLAAAGGVVFAGVLPGNGGRSVEGGQVVERLVGPDELRHLVGAVGRLFRFDGVGPAEVVEDGDAAEVAADGNDAPHGLVDDRGGHVVGVDVGKPRVDALGQHRAAGGVVLHAHDGGVGGDIGVDADIGLHDGEPLDLAVVDAALVLARAEVEVAHHLDERVGIVFQGLDFRRGDFGLFPDAGHGEDGAALLVEEVHVEAGDHLAVVFDGEVAGVVEAAHEGDLDIAAAGERLERLAALRRDGEGHAFLRLGDEDFPGLEPFVLEGGAGEFALAAAGIFAHLAEGAGDAARAVVGDAAVEAEVARLEQEFVELALGERVADLHRLGGRFGAQLLGGEGGAVDAVLADAAAAHDRPVAHLDLLALGGAAVDLDGDGAHGSAVDQRLAQVALVEALEPAAVGDAGLVAAIDHPFVYAVANTAGVHQPLGDLLVVEGRAEAVAPDIGNQRGAHARAERVAVDAHDAGHRPAVGVERGGGVVRFHLVDQMQPVVELHDAGVVGEDRNQPVDGLGNLVGGGLHIGFVERVDHLLLAGLLVAVVDGSGKDLVRAVLRPGLGDALQLHIGRPFGQAQLRAVRLHIPAQVVAADGAHLVERQRKDAVGRNLHQRLVVVGQLDGVDADFGMVVEDGSLEAGFGGEPLLAGEDLDGLDEGVGKQILSEALDIFARKVARNEILDAGVDLLLPLQLAPGHILQRAAGRAPHIVGNPRLEADLEHPVEAFRGREPVHRGFGHDRIGKGLAHLFRQRLVDVRRHLVDIARAAGIDLHAQRPLRAMNHPATARVRHAVLQTDLDSVNHGSSLLDSVRRKDGGDTTPKGEKRHSEKRGNASGGKHVPQPGREGF